MYRKSHICIRALQTRNEPHPPFIVCFAYCILLEVEKMKSFLFSLVVLFLVVSAFAVPAREGHSRMVRAAKYVVVVNNRYLVSYDAKYEVTE